MKPANHKRLTAYLSGGMQYADGRGADWRGMMSAWLQQELRHRSINPVRSSDLLMARMRGAGAKLGARDRRGGDWPAFFRAVVDTDTNLVARRSDYVICLWNASARRGAGTQGELTVARMQRIPVYIVSRVPLDRMPGWVQGCVTRHFGGWKSLKMFLLEQHSSL